MHDCLATAVQAAVQLLYQYVGVVTAAGGASRELRSIFA